MDEPETLQGLNRNYIRSVQESDVGWFEAEDVRIRILGDVAIIHARTTYTKAGGEPGAGRYTDIWRRRPERWLCVAAHVSRR